MKNDGSLRDWFAGQALAGDLGNASANDGPLILSDGQTADEAMSLYWLDRAKFYYIVADAMLKARKE